MFEIVYRRGFAKQAKDQGEEEIKSTIVNVRQSARAIGDSRRPARRGYASVLLEDFGNLRRAKQRVETEVVQASVTCNWQATAAKRRGGTEYERESRTGLYREI